MDGKLAAADVASHPLRHCQCWRDDACQKRRNGSEDHLVLAAKVIGIAFVQKIVAEIEENWLVPIVGAGDEVDDASVHPLDDDQRIDLLQPAAGHVGIGVEGMLEAPLREHARDMKATVTSRGRVDVKTREEPTEAHCAYAALRVGELAQPTGSLHASR